MAHFAELGASNNVLRVVVIANGDCLDGDGNESEAVGIAFCENLFGGGTWKQTSYNNNFRKQYAAIDYIAYVNDSTGLTMFYDAAKDKFIIENPYPSWTLDANDDWQAQVDKPDEINCWDWDETAYTADNTKGWTKFSPWIPE
jgi:hypothetical protein